MEDLFFFIEGIGDTIWISTGTPITMVIGNLLIILLIYYFGPKLILSFAENENKYNVSPLITDQLFLRAGVCMMILAYLALPLFIIISHLLGFHIIQFNSITEILSIYWAVIVVLPLSVIGWIHSNQKENDYLLDIIQSHESSLMQIKEATVIAADVKNSAAYSTRKLNDQQYIIINSQLENQLSREEIIAICYHELYHLENNTHRFQNIIELPIVGYLLFFVFVNPISIHKEEFRADDYAAENVSQEALASAMEKSESMNLGPSDSPLKQFVHEEGRWVGFNLFWKVPILLLYRPRRLVRINRLRASKTS